jgi:outer membrane putative beta-barrel porin/alpha-amylase
MRVLAMSTALVVLLVLGTGAQAAAQPLSQIVPNLLTPDTVINAQGNLPGIGHRAHFVPDFDQLITPVIINQSMKGQLPTFPIGSSSGSLTYTFDPALGTFRRSSESFGPSFAERPLTIGRRKFSLGLNYQHSRYRSFEGKDLDNGDMKFYVRHNDCCPGQNPDTGAPGPNPPGEPVIPAFEGDLIETALALDLKSDIASVFANYGVTDRFDVAVAIPLVRVGLDASVTSTIVRLATGSNPTIHLFQGSDPNVLRRAQGGNANGIGDVLLRTKAKLFQGSGGGFAAAVDLRLPTGDEEELLGTGETQAKIFGIASVTAGRLSPHVNFGYTFSTGDLPDEINYTVGFDAVLAPRLSFAADIIGRTLRDAGRFEEVTRTFSFVTLEDPAGAPLRTTDRQQLQFRQGDLNLALGAVGFKLNLGGTVLFTANFLFSLTEAGLRPGVTPVFGFDYAF